MSHALCACVRVCVCVCVMAEQTKKYRNDDYDWKMRREFENAVREDRMKLRVGGYQVSLATSI